MINLDEINKTILELEGHDTTFATVEKLAWLYIVRDHMTGNEEAKRMGKYTGSEFCRECSDVPMDTFMKVMDEHMDAIRLIYPKEYNAILEKMKK